MEYWRCTKNEWLILSGISVRPVMIYISVIDYISIITYFTPDIDAHCCEWFILLILYIRAILFNKMQTMNGSWIEKEK